ncbi:MAG TPA: MFS transporter [Mycobacteriales bacterium]|nr:MFS transporter [Mycobacteriales bacterium]
MPPDPAPEIRSARDVVELVNSGTAKGQNSRAIVLIALGGIFIDAYDFTSISFGLPDISKQFGLDAFMIGVVGAAIMVGALVGALAGGYLIDKLGRYRLFMADMLFFVVSAIGCGLAPEEWSLIVFRFLMGIGIGIDFPVALAFIAEYTALRGKGGRVSLWQPMWYVATSATFAFLIPLYYLVPTDDLWRWIVGLGALPALVVMLVRHRYMEESPAWAANQGDLERAAEILHKSYGLRVTVAPDADRTPVVHRQPSVREFARLFTPQYRRRTIVAGTVGICQSMQYFAVGFTLPTIISGILDQGRIETILGSLIFNLVFGITGGFLGVALTYRLGSWWLATSGFAVCVVVLPLLAGIGHPDGTAWTVAVGALLGVFVFFHSYGPGAQGMTMATLSYPTSIRGLGAGFSQAFLRVGATVSLLAFPQLSDAMGENSFYIVALAPAIGLIVLLLIRWEPVGKDIDAEDYQQADQPTTVEAI